MQVSAEQLGGQLKRGLAPLYFVSGDEPLLIDECIGAIRQAAAAAGFAEREVVSVENGFDWNGFYVSLQSGSLFAARRLVELRLPTGKPGDAGGKILAELAATPSPDIVLVLRCGKLERAVRATRWAKAFESAAVTVTVYPLETSQLSGWIARRLRAAGLTPGPGVTELLAFHTEGNLLAAAQEIGKLAMQFINADGGTAEIGLDDIEGVLGDNARYSVFALGDACLRGNAADIVRILRTLRAEGEAPALVCWTLVREVRLLAKLAAELSGSGARLEQVLDAHRDLVWAKRRALVSQALKRGNEKFWRSRLKQAARADRVVKGRADGEPWHTLECLALAVGGTRLASC